MLATARRLTCLTATLLAIAATLGACASAPAAAPAATPAQAPTPVPPEVLGRGFGPIEAYAGMRFVESTTYLQVTAQDANTLRIEVVDAGTNRPEIGYLLHRTAHLGVYTVTRLKHGRPDTEDDGHHAARLTPDGTIEIVTTYSRGRHIRERFTASSEGVSRHVSGRYHTAFDNTYPYGHDSEAARQRAAANARAFAQQQRADAQAKRAAQAENTARVLGAIQGAVTEASAEADVRRAEEDRRAAAAQREAQRVADARRTTNTAGTSSATAATPSHAPSSAPSTVSSGGAATAARPQAAPARATAPTSGAAGRSSTDTDANRCVSSPETRLNDTYAGNTSATVLNGCGQPVDVRICLMTERTEGGATWNCGVDYNVAGQARASHSSFKATGPVFVDARVTGSSRPLAYPSGYRP